jgi:citrate lyase subunit beta/citryl-CoA lyase
MGDVIRRSWLLVPVSETREVEEAAAAEADVVVLDLMELVPERAKPMAREGLPEAIRAVGRGGAEVFVQIDRDLSFADLTAAIWPGLTGVIVPRVESPQDLAEVDTLVTQLEGDRGVRPGTVQLVAALETARGNYAAMEIARASARLWGLTLGRADLLMDLRPEPSGELHLLPYLMQRLITVANAASLVPIGAWWRAPARGLLASPDDTYRAAVRGRRIGFKGSLCLRADQVEALNRGFTPDADDVERGRELTAGYREETANGAALLREGDAIVDLATATQASQVLAYAEACARRDAEKAQARQRTAR